MSFSAALSLDDNIGHLCIGEQSPMVLPFKWNRLAEIWHKTMDFTKLRNLEFNYILYLWSLEVKQLMILEKKGSNDGTIPKGLPRVESILP